MKKKVIVLFILVILYCTIGVYAAESNFGYNFKDLRTFLGLTDTPAAYTGAGGNCVKVGAGETALEFGACAGGSIIDTNATTECGADEVLDGDGDCVDHTLWLTSFTDTNATTECSDGETLFGDGSCQPVYNKSKVDDIASAIAFDFFFTNLTSDISGHYNMTEIDLGKPEAELVSSSLSAGTASIFNWTSEIGMPEFNEMRPGVYDVHVHLKKTGTKSVQIIPKLYNVSSDGSSRTLFLTFETSDFLTTSSVEFDLHGSLADTIILAPGNRLTLELEAVVGSSGSNPTVTARVEGTTDTHLSIETSSNAFEKIFLRQDGTTPLTGNWDFGNFNIYGSGNFTTTGWLNAENLNITGTSYLGTMMLERGNMTGNLVLDKGVGSSPRIDMVNADDEAFYWYHTIDSVNMYSAVNPFRIYAADANKYFILQTTDGVPEISSSTGEIKFDADLDFSSRNIINISNLSVEGNNLIVGSCTYTEPFDGYKAQGNVQLFIRQPAATSSTTPYPSIVLSNNQSDGTNGNVAALRWMNEYISADNKRLAEIWVRTDGGTDDGKMQFHTFASGTKRSPLTLTSAGTTIMGDGGSNVAYVDMTGDLHFTGSAGFYPRRIRQAAIPAAGTGATQIDTDEMMFWEDSDDDSVYLVYNDKTAGIKSVELT